MWASLASLSLQTDAAGWEGCPPISWPTVPTTPEWGGDLCHSEHYGLWAISQGPGRSEDRLTVLGMGVASQARGRPRRPPCWP